MDLRTFLKSSLICRASSAPLTTYSLPPFSTHAASAAGSAWTYRLSMTADGPAAQAVSYAVPGIGELEVAKRIAWQRVTVTPEEPARAQPIVLPLSAKFLLGFKHVTGGSVRRSETHAFWRMPLTVSLGSLLIFGYYLGGGAKPQALPRNSLDAWRRTRLVMPPGGSLLGSTGADRYVFVCVELVLCEADDRYEPFGIANIARLYPLTHVFCTFPAASVKAAVELERPAHTGLPHHNHLGNDGRVVNAVFADRNTKISLLQGLPTWDKLFDCYAYEPDGAYEIIGQQGARTSTSVREAYGLAPNFLGGGYQPTSVSKRARQGAFDNIHIAPQLKLTPMALVSQTYTFSMAPVCHHDCLHTHWRWSSGFTADYVKGWSANGPNTAVGAPMVPTNQTVTMQMEPDVPGFTYVAEAADVAANGWSVFFHHGSGYLDSFDRMDLRGLGAEMGGIALGWEQFYFKIAYSPTRYIGTIPEKFTPRIRADLDDFAAV